jgi:DNA-binding response OmpR family regulator
VGSSVRISEPVGLSACRTPLSASSASVHPDLKSRTAPAWAQVCGSPNLWDWVLAEHLFPRVLTDSACGSAVASCADDWRRLTRFRQRGAIRCNDGGMSSNDHGTIVVVEDDTNIADLLDMYLRQAGYRVIQAATGELGLAACERERPKLVILDVGLPGNLDGLDVCRALRAKSDVPVLFLTARDSEIDRVLGLEMGADDYVTKPFSPREMVARVKAVLRRMEPSTKETRPETLVAGQVEVDLARREARIGTETVALATREFDLLAYFASNQGLVLSRQQLLDGVWGVGWYGDERTVDVHVRQLRKKLDDSFPLKTVFGVGYRLN